MSIPPDTLTKTGEPCVDFLANRPERTQEKFTRGSAGNNKEHGTESRALSCSLTDAMLTVCPVDSLSQLVNKWEEGGRSCAVGRWGTTRRILTEHARLVGAERALTRLTCRYRLRARLVSNVRYGLCPKGGRSC